MELELISHKHPLVFKEVQKNDGARIICNGCSKRVWGSHYSCKECNFDLHKSCAEQPRELKHPLHPKHPLTLFQGVWSWGKCGACNGELWGFSYHCSHCEFKLHFKCAVLPLSLEAESHDHPFTLVRKSLSFTCDACGKEGNGMFYLCAICPILVHLECASLPLTVRHIRHKHPLSLAYVNQSDHPWICQLCVEKVDTNYRVYCCSNCHFVAHLNCATHNERFLRDEEPIESTPIPENSELDESIDSLLSYVVKKIELGEDKIEKAVQIKHFSHEHDLELTDELETNEKCDACTRKIFSPFYRCAQCSFFLHKSCAELPRKKQHPLHQHPLILLPQAPYSGGFFQCLACDMLCNGFTYYCDKCHFNLDVQCGLLSDSFILDGHEHQLILSSTSNYYKCSSCDRHGSIFRCVDCEFTLDYVCATLPPTVRYKSYEQFFTLCYSTAEDSDGEYYCDICEEERDPTHWFYYCGDLSFPAHPRCILGNYPYMKFGRTYTFDIHPHPLTCLQRTKEHTPCDGCDGSVSYAGLAFECAKCDFNLDEWCLREMVEGPSQL